MRRQLSQMLILIVMLLSPLTFSTDKVPNFVPDGETCSSFRVKSEQIATVARITPSPKASRTQQAVSRYTTADPRTPHIASIAIPLRGRAPPSSPSITG
jgi:hypothetical protein